MENNNPQKIIKGRYQVVPRTLILLVNGLSVLLQKGDENKKIWAGFYNGLGGHVERGEDIYSAAKRELLEEAGINSPDLRLAGMVTIDVHEDQGILMFVFTGQEIEGMVNRSDEGAVEWVKISELQFKKTVEDIPMLVELLNLHKGEIFFGHYAYDQNGKLTASFNFEK